MAQVCNQTVEYCPSDLIERKQMLVSVIIPSKNRHPQLMDTLRAHATLGLLDDLEMVIADNSSSEMSDVLIAECKSIFKNFVYCNDTNTKSIIANFNFGLKLATGQFSIFIGDDDFVLPEIVDAARMALQENIDCLIYAPDKYYWNSCVFAVASEIGPRCLVKGPEQASRYIDPRVELEKSARNGFLTIESLPRAYHGLVRRAKMLQLSGNPAYPIVGGSPDISMAVALALGGITTYFWSRPLSIYGASTGSGGGMTTSRTHLLRLHEATFLESDFISTWSGMIPAYWSEYTVFPASALYMYNYFDKTPTGFNLARVYASVLVNEKSMYKEVGKTFMKLPTSRKIEVAFRAPAAFARKFGGALARSSVISKARGRVVSQVVTAGVEPTSILPSYAVASHES